MKKKRILVIYNNNGNLESQITKQIMSHKLQVELVEEGRTAIRITPTNALSSTIITYDDGSKLVVEPFGRALIGNRFTHIYIDESCLDIPKGRDFIDEGVMVTFVGETLKKAYPNWDTEGDRVFTFSKGEDNKLSINTYRKEVNE